MLNILDLDKERHLALVDNVLHAYLISFIFPTVLNGIHIINLKCQYYFSDLRNDKRTDGGAPQAHGIGKW